MKIIRFSAINVAQVHSYTSRGTHFCNQFVDTCGLELITLALESAEAHVGHVGSSLQLFLS